MRWVSKNCSFAVACVAAGALSICANGDQSGKTYTLRAKYVPNEKHTYDIMTAFSGVTEDNKTVGLEMSVSMKVLEVKNGNASIRLEFSAPKNGKTVLPYHIKPIKIVLNSQNRPVGNSNTGQIFSVLPDHPVKIGDKWSGVSSLMMQSNTGSMVSTTYTLNDVKAYKGRNIAEIKMSLGGMAGGEGTELVDLADGSMLTSVLKLKSKTPNGKTLPIDILLRRQN